MRYIFPARGNAKQELLNHEPVFSALYEIQPMQLKKLLLALITKM